MQVALQKPWAEFLAAVDGGLSEAVSLAVIGGFPLATAYGLPRPTNDIDYVAVTPAAAAETIELIGGRDSVLAKRYRICFQHVGVADLPEDYEGRLTELEVDLHRLHLWMLDPYDLLLSKLPRNSPKDREDVKFIARKLQLQYDIIYARWTAEMKPWISNPERHELTLQQLWKEYF